MQANVDPAFTCLVWQKLLDQNPNFFYGYALRLRLKDQVIAFNYLVDQHQKMLMAQKEGGVQSSGSSSSFLQEQQLMHLSQLQNMYSQQAAQQSNNATGVRPNSSPVYPARPPTEEDQVQALAAAASKGSSRPITIPLGPDQEPLSLDPNSLGSGGLDGASILTPMVNAVAAAAANSYSFPQTHGNVGQAKANTHFFPPTPSENAK